MDGRESTLGDAEEGVWKKGRERERERAKEQKSGDSEESGESEASC